MVSHLEKLNAAQREAVESTEGPLLVLAGAGAGKTRVIAHRILEIVRRGTAPEHILAITFTNKAATEMRERILDLLRSAGAADLPRSAAGHRGDASRFKSAAPFVSTFHSLGLSIIKENAKLLGFSRAPTIFDRADSLREMKAALKHFDESFEPRAALSMLSRAKGQGMTLSDYGSSARTYREEVVTKAWVLYEEALRKEQALDFDDLLLRAMLLLRDNATVRARYQSRWHYIHVDEYQDTNYVQAELLELLVGPERHVCAVGDVDQTIYGWRGAEIKNIMSFEKVFPGAKVVVLEENYRSTKAILQAANEVIAKNQYRPEKNLFTKNIDGEELGLYQAFDEVDEANFIARKVREMIEGGERSGAKLRPKDFAVLYRANFQSRAIEESLLRADMPYQVLGTRFFERKEVKDALSFVRAALYETSGDLARIANVPPRGIGKVTLLKILSGKEGELKGAVREKVRELRKLLRDIAEAAQGQLPSELMRFVISQTGMERLYKEDRLEGAERLENLRELVSLAARYDHLPPGEGVANFLESAALASDQDELKDEADAVRLMTVHASKGLEFPVVFIAGLEEGLFPYAREDDESSDKEEERRLMYVAITRAQKKVYLCYASYRTVFGAKSPTLPSQFLSDIPGELLELEMPERLGKTIYLD